MATIGQLEECDVADLVLDHLRESCDCVSSLHRCRDRVGERLQHGGVLEFDAVAIPVDVEGEGADQLPLGAEHLHGLRRQRGERLLHPRLDHLEFRPSRAV